MEMVPLRSTSPAELHHSPTISSRSQLDDDGIEAHQNGRDQKTVDHTQSAEPHGPRHRSTALEPRKCLHKSIADPHVPFRSHGHTIKFQIKAS